jgi:hypothetical protein
MQRLYASCIRVACKAICESDAHTLHTYTQIITNGVMMVLMIEENRKKNQRLMRIAYARELTTRQPYLPMAVPVSGDSLHRRHRGSIDLGPRPAVAGPYLSQAIAVGRIVFLLVDLRESFSTWWLQANKSWARTD